MADGDAGMNQHACELVAASFACDVVHRRGHGGRRVWLERPSEGSMGVPTSLFFSSGFIWACDLSIGPEGIEQACLYWPADGQLASRPDRQTARQADTQRQTAGSCSGAGEEPPIGFR